MHLRAPFLAVFLGAVACQAQWTDTQTLGVGGEPSLATDGLGHVYVTCHLNASFFSSWDWGSTYTLRKTFGDACCDVDVVTAPTGTVLVSYLLGGLNGVTAWRSSDFGLSLSRSTAPTGSLDREWLAADPATGNLYMDYSAGYIGGPLSTGIYCARSTDDGRTFLQSGRCDDDVPPDYPVDPYLASSSTGTVYAMWATSQDYNTIDRFRFSRSLDGGTTFTGQVTLADAHKALGDTQERWMLGSLVAFGANRVWAFYPDYKTVTVDGNTYNPLLVHYVASTDGGQTFTPPRTVSTPTEIANSIRSFEKARLGVSNYAYYLQTLPWASVDPFGQVHVVFEDNRDGQTLLNGQPYDRWHVRHTSGWNAFGASERVSGDYTSLRPPLDFIACGADAKNVYVTWVETPNSTVGWNFSGNLMVARKVNVPIQPVVAVPF